MLAALDVASVAELVDRAVPEAIRDRLPLDLPAGLTEAEALARLRELADRNRVLTSLIGMGYSGTITPPVIQRNVLENPAWYTAYTPYQPEISQGRLEALLNFQTMVSDLTGMDLANASLLDEATAAAEAMTLLRRVNAKAGDVFFVDAECHPQTIDVVRTRAEPIGIDVVVGVPERHMPAEGVFGVLLQYPGTTGVIRDDRELVANLHAQGTLVAVAADLLALVLLAPPGEWGADVVVGSAQRFGVPMGYGGPHAGFFATRDEYKRNMPGRIVGVSVDAAGRPALRLALQTREQHIRREKATSNICTAQVLLANIAGMYAIYHGPDGLRAIATACTTSPSSSRRDCGLPGSRCAPDRSSTRSPSTSPTPTPCWSRRRERGCNLRRVDDDAVGIALDETTTREITSDVAAVFGAGLPDAFAVTLEHTWWMRTSEILVHPVFRTYHSETQMLRYLRRLADRDLALDRTMIPLGSCTMKLNATTEMMPITWPEFANLHPFAPADQAEGYAELFAGPRGRAVRDHRVRRGVAPAERRIAGRARGAARHPRLPRGSRPGGADRLPHPRVGPRHQRRQRGDGRDARGRGEVRRRRQRRLRRPEGEGPRARRRPLGVDGDVPVDPRRVREQHPRRVRRSCTSAAGRCTSTAPTSTRSSASPSRASSVPTCRTSTSTRRSASPTVGEGRASARSRCASTWRRTSRRTSRPRRTAPPASCRSRTPTSRSWAATACCGRPKSRSSAPTTSPPGCGRTTRCSTAVPAGWSRTSASSTCARSPQATGVTVDDVAKRLVDYGFHAPTMSFPVAGTLMVEPTESEDLAELDRFCDAMIAIRDEIRAVEAGEWAVDDSPLRHAPHAAADVVATDWAHPYTREQAAFPPGAVADPGDKYWPPVNRIDGAYGDRNLMCSCPPLSAYDADDGED